MTSSTSGGGYSRISNSGPVFEKKKGGLRKGNSPRRKARGDFSEISGNFHLVGRANPFNFFSYLRSTGQGSWRLFNIEMDSISIGQYLNVI